MKRMITVIIVTLCSSVIFGQALSKKELTQRMNKLLEDDYFSRTQIGVRIYDMDADETLYKHNERLLFRPASNMKILTTAASLVYLGPDYNFTTSVYYDGDITDGTLRGDLFVKGGCDPDFTTEDMNALIDSIKEKGVTKITGNIYGDVSMLDSLFWGSGWMWDDDPYTDFPYLTPLIVNDAAVKVLYSPAKVGRPVNVKIKPESDFFNYVNKSETVLYPKRGDEKFEVNRDWMHRRNDIIIRGAYSMLNGEDSTELNIFNPTEYYLYLMQENVKRKGISFSGITDTMTIPAGADSLVSVKRPYNEVIVNLNKQSDNLSAEMSLRALGKKYYGEPSSARKGTRKIDDLITAAGMDPDDYKIVDGSGVSHYNLVTAELISKVLEYMYDEHRELYDILRASFPTGGIDGTLEYRMNNKLTYKNVHAKTGTLSGVSALSGYLKSLNGHNITFSIIVQNYVGSSYEARNFQDKICEIAARYK